MATSRHARRALARQKAKRLAIVQANLSNPVKRERSEHLVSRDVYRGATAARFTGRGVSYRHDA